MKMTADSNTHARTEEIVIIDHRGHDRTMDSTSIVTKNKTSAMKHMPKIQANAVFMCKLSLVLSV